MWGVHRRSSPRFEASAPPANGTGRWWEGALHPATVVGYRATLTSRGKALGEAGWTSAPEGQWSRAPATSVFQTRYSADCAMFGHNMQIIFDRKCMNSMSSGQCSRSPARDFRGRRTFSFSDRSVIIKNMRTSEGSNRRHTRANCRGVAAVVDRLAQRSGSHCSRSAAASEVLRKVDLSPNGPASPGIIS
jgi:hypothetical protein